SLWDLMHAVKRAELLVARTPLAVFWSALGSLLEHFDMFANTNELRLQTGAGDRYGDFSSTSLSGRLAQGITFLFMHRAGYPYGERLDSLLNRMQSGGNPLPWGLRQRVLRGVGTTAPSRSPDFIFESVDQQTALAEAKGAFVADDTA